MTDIGNEINSLLEELAKDHVLGKRMPGDVSVEDFAKATGLSMCRSSSILRSKIASGELIHVRVRGENGFPIYVYRKP